MSRLLIIPLALVCFLAVFMRLSGTVAERPADFAFINRGDIYTLDINQMSYLQDFRLTYGIREGLFALAPETFETIPAGATSYEQSPDKLTWTFHLRPGAKWGNGDPVTARDYVFSWRRMLEEPGEYTYLFKYMRNAEGYQKSYASGNPIDFTTVGMTPVDDHTLVVKLDNPVPYLLDLMAFPPFYPRHERSMAPFRIYTDVDVMDPFARYVAAAKASGGDAARFAERLSKDDHAEAAAVPAWVAFARTFNAKSATQAETLNALAVFATLKPFPVTPRAPAATATTTPTTGPTTGPTTDATAPAGGDEAAPVDTLSPLPPDQKLARMLEGRFLRYTYDKAYTLPPQVVTNGPFNLVRWDFKRRLRLERSDTYWDKANVKLGSVEMVVAENPQSQLLLYETGQVDWNADVNGDQAAELKAKGRTDLRTSPAFGTMFLTLLCEKNLPKSLGGASNPLSIMKVRQALAMAIDKRFIVDNITRMGELPARTYFPPDGTLPTFTWQPGPYDQGRKENYTYKDLQASLPSDTGLTGNGPGLPYNVERARALLAEAGFPNGQGFPSLPILYPTSSATRRDICQVLKNQWKQALNIDVQIQGVEGKIFSKMNSNKDYAISCVAWYGDYPDVTTFTDKYLPESLQNDSAWVNLAYAKLCDAATREPDEAKRMDLLSRAEAMIDTEMPIIPIYHYVTISLSRDGVHGVMPNPRNVTIFKHIWVDRGAK